jgi:hypothetical protein
VEFSCDVLPDTNHPREIELLFRNYGLSGEWETGPVITVKADGTVSAGGRSVAGTPGWIHLAVRFNQGAKGKGTYKLTVRSSNGRTETLKNLRFRDRTFSSCNWFGVVSPGRGKGIFYMDNLQIDLKETDGCR